MSPVVLSPQPIGGGGGVGGGALWQFFRDSLLLQPFSSLTWEDPLRLGRVAHPPRVKNNLIPNGDFATTLVNNVQVNSGFSLNIIPERSAGGPQILQCTCTTAGQFFTLTPLSSLVLAAVPRTFYSCGIDVTNGATAARHFQITVTLGDRVYTGDVFTILPGEKQRVFVDGVIAPYVLMQQVMPQGLSWHVPASFTLVCLDTSAPSDTIGISQIYFGTGKSSDYFPTEYYLPGTTVKSATPVKLWAKNISMISLGFPRVCAMPVGPDAARPTIEASLNPDVYGWTPAFNRAARFANGVFTTGQSFSFWLRVVLDETVPPDVQDFVLMMLADFDVIIIS